MAFKDGMGVSTTNAARYLVALFFVSFSKDTQKKVKLPPQERYKALALGISVFVIGLGYLGATQYIPVSLAVLIFYSFPIFVAVISRFTEKEPITIIRLCAVINEREADLSCYSICHMTWRAAFTCSFVWYTIASFADGDMDLTRVSFI
jgi:threonine/homoserine efflux transporter RhtA